MSDERKPKGVAEAPAPAFEVEAPAQKRRPGALKVRRVGNSLGVVLPKEVLAKLRAGEGDFLTVSETPDGVALTREEDEADLLKLAEDIMRERRKVLKALAQ